MSTPTAQGSNTAPRPLQHVQCFGAGVERPYALQPVAGVEHALHQACPQLAGLYAPHSIGGVPIGGLGQIGIGGLGLPFPFQLAQVEPQRLFAPVAPAGAVQALQQESPPGLVLERLGARADKTDAALVTIAESLARQVEALARLVPDPSQGNAVRTQGAQEPPVPCPVKEDVPDAAHLAQESNAYHKDWNKHDGWEDHRQE